MFFLNFEMSLIFPRHFGRVVFLEKELRELPPLPKDMLSPASFAVTMLSLWLLRVFMFSEAYWRS